MLCCVVTTDDTIGEGFGECVWVGGVEEVGDVEEGRRSRMQIDQPWGEKRRCQTQMLRWVLGGMVVYPVCQKNQMFFSFVTGLGWRMS